MIKNFVNCSGKFQKHVQCKRCWSLYTLGESLLIKSCAHRPLRRSRYCGEPLHKSIVSANGRNKLYSHTIFCFSTLNQALILRPGFIKQCKSTRKRIFSDIRNVEGRPKCQCTCFSFISWYAFEYWLVSTIWTLYFVGVIFIILMNLPCSLQFKREKSNLIPGPSEPSLTVNSTLSPLSFLICRVEYNLIIPN